MPAKSPQTKKVSKLTNILAYCWKMLKLRVQEVILNKSTREYCSESQLQNTVLFKVNINLKWQIWTFYKEFSILASLSLIILGLWGHNVVKRL